MNNVSRRAELLAGTALAMALLLAVVLVFRAFGGAYSSHVDVTAEISQLGDSLDVGNIVTYREVIVGEVRSFRADGHGGAVLDLRLDPQTAGSIPSDVTAVGIPADLFGQTAILLQSTPGTTAAGLRAGDHISADTSPGATGLQSALAEAYNVISTVQPAQLNAALSAINTALQDNGQNIGKLIDTTDALTGQVIPAVPKLDQVLRKLAVVSTQLASSSPDLIAAAQNLLVPARAIVAQRAAITRILDIAPQTLADATDLTGKIGDNFVTVVTNSKPVLDAVAQNPRGLAGSVTGFGSLADAFNSVIHNGRLNINVYVTGVNAAALVPVLLGQPSHILDSTATPFPASSSRASAITTGRDTVPGSTVGGPAEVALTRTLVSSITGVPVARVPGAVDLLLGPMLRGASTVIQ